MLTQKSPHIIWVCPDSKMFYRSKGEVKCRPGSVIPKLAERALTVNVLLPYDAALLPKTRLAPARITRHVIHLSQPFQIEIIKLTRGAVSPGIYMARIPVAEPALHSALLSKAAIALGKQLNMPVDIYHVFGWQGSLVPLFLELEKNGSKIFSETRTFLNVSSLKDQGNFAPTVMSQLGLPNTLFHPEGIEFYGKVSFLKSALLFSDGVGLIENGMAHRSMAYRNGTGLEGVLDRMMHKLRRWASERSLKSHVDAYEELLATPKRKPLLPTLIEKLATTTQESVDNFLESWGPLLPERYNFDYISFLVQSPKKAYTFWEWTGRSHAEFGLILENRSSNARWLLSRGLPALGEFWLDVEPDTEYVTEVVGWTHGGTMETLLRSKPVRTPRSGLSPNTNAIFIDVRSRKIFASDGVKDWNALLRSLHFGSSIVWERGEQPPAPLKEIQGMPGSMPTSLPSSMPSSLPSSFRVDSSR